MQGAGAQFNVSGPGFLPDENGTNLDDPQAKKGIPKMAAGAVIKDCAECPEMVVIPAGSFVMGSNANAEEKPLHTVTIRSFLIGRTEVTQKLWLNVMGGNPSDFANCGQECPVEKVNFYSAQEFITRLNQKTGQEYRLPSEAEWEYAARAGSTTEWSFGSDDSKLGNYAWHSGNSGGKTHEVGRKSPNAFGLFDMYGNVLEWIQDCWHENYGGAPTDGSAWITGRNWVTTCSRYYGNREFQVLRGGSWNSNPVNLRSTYRTGLNPGFSTNHIGFRLARDL